MTVDEIDAAADQPVREADLIRAHGIAPVGSPVDGDDHDVTGPLGRPRPADDVIGGRVGQIGQEIDAGPARGGGPARRDPAGDRPAGEDHHAAAARHRDSRRPPGLIGVTPGAHRPQPGTGHGFQGVLQPPAAEIEHVIVRQRAGIGPDRGQARNIARAHPVVNGLARREVPAAGDAGLQVDHPDIRGDILQHLQGIPQGQAKPAGRGIRPWARSASRTYARASATYLSRSSGSPGCGSTWSTPRPVITSPHKNKVSSPSPTPPTLPGRRKQAQLQRQPIGGKARRRG